MKRRQDVRGLSWRIKIIEEKAGSQGFILENKEPLRACRKSGVYPGWRIKIIEENAGSQGFILEKKIIEEKAGSHGFILENKDH